MRIDIARVSGAGASICMMRMAELHKEPGYSRRYKELKNIKKDY